MKILLWLSLALTALSILVPVETDSQRCMVIYSTNEQDTIKIGLKFPSDKRITEFYDFHIKVRDLYGQTIMSDRIANQVWRTELAVPNQTIYEACISIKINETKIHNSSLRYRGEVLVNYEANTHFVSSNHKMPELYETIKQQEITVMKAQVQDIISITKQFLELQKIQRDEETQEYEEKRYVEQSLFEWWMLELVLIVILGVYQWNRMKRKLQAKNE